MKKTDWKELTAGCAWYKKGEQGEYITLKLAIPNARGKPIDRFFNLFENKNRKQDTHPNWVVWEPPVDKERDHKEDPWWNYRCGSAWENTSGRGNRYLSLKMTVDEMDYSFMLFENINRNQENSPDFIAYKKSEPTQTKSYNKTNEQQAQKEEEAQTHSQRVSEEEAQSNMVEEEDSEDAARYLGGDIEGDVQDHFDHENIEL